jgi:hypothetical protein
VTSLATTPLLAAGALTAVAALAHLACIAIGAPAYRWMGAGERMARAVEAGRLRPTLVTLAIAVVLMVWAAYAFAGAGVIGPLPFTRWVLAAIGLVFVARAVAFPWLKPLFPENSNRFWWVSSGICLLIGSLYGWGAAAL